MEQQIEQDLQEQQNSNRKISPEEVEREIVKLVTRHSKIMKIHRKFL